jgi:hypothetical protein
MHPSSRILPALCLFASLATAGQITYTLVKADNPTADQLDAYGRIQKAMDSAVIMYNAYTDIRCHINVQYAPSVPTADGGGATIRFGAGRVYMVTPTGMHEMAHCVGLGTAPEWKSFVSNGIFTGPLTTAALRKIVGNDTAHLHIADSVHIVSPWGLNYATDVKSTADLVNHCKIVDAMHKDLFHESTYVEGRIRNVSTKQCISRSGSGLVMGSCTDTASFVRVVRMGDTSYVYYLGLGDEVLDAPNHSTQAGLAMSVYSLNWGTNQRFQLEASPGSGGRANRLKMVHSNLYLHPSGTSVIQDSALGGGVSDWELVKGSVASEEVTLLEGRVRNASTQQCITLSGSALAMGSCADTASFVRVVKMGGANPVYRLELGFQVLDAPEQSAKAGLAMGTYAWNAGTNQEFQLEASPLAGGKANRLKMVHSNLYLHPSGSSVVQDAVTTGSGFDWELIKGSVPVTTGVAISRPQVVPRNVGLGIDVLGRRVSGSQARLPSGALRTFPPP